ncbi:hypothetical protein PMIT1342_01772 [Prochlorococcus marinus str. MIT 1342]|nr:hypothetical protein PMIT1342_01772 [Prochlorococcus marinus str. MIT 1342]
MENANKKAFAVVNWWTKINKTNGKNSNLKKARMTRLRVFHINAMAIDKDNLLIIISLIRTTGSLL